MNVARYRQHEREVCIFTTRTGTHDASIYGAPTSRTAPPDEQPDNEIPPDLQGKASRRGRRTRPEPAENVVVTRPCLYTLRNGTLTDLSNFLSTHGLFLPDDIEDLLWHQNVHFHARERQEEDPAAVLTDWGDRTPPA